MRTLVVGIDSGTQSTKVLIVDAKNGKVVSSAAQSYDLSPDLPPGAKEQHPQTWRDATAKALKQALKAAKAKADEVKAIGVSGQQHGFVPLDDQGEVIRPAKLWCDTTTAEECTEITERVGGPKATIRAIGNAVLPGFTAPKILWLKKNEPKNFRRLAKVLLPHDYLNYWLSGEMAMEYGDASGTALLDVRKRKWSQAVLDAIDSDLIDKLPPLISSERPAGRLQASTAKALGLNTDVVVSAGGGDNMMGAIGTGNIKPGVITASFGTSGTLYGVAAAPVVDGQGEVAAFCDSTDQWLPLVCTMNVTVVTEQVRELFGWDIKRLEAEVAAAPVGSGGITFLPYLNGERTPNLPGGSGVLHGLRTGNMTPGNLARAAVEGATLGLAYGLKRFRDLGMNPAEIRLTGGGSKSPVWRQIAADCFNAEVVTLSTCEGAALGAAIQAAYARANEGVEKELVSYDTLCERLVELDESTRSHPDPANAACYAEQLERQMELTSRLHQSEWL